MRENKSVEVFINAHSGLGKSEDARRILDELFQKHGLTAHIRIAHRAGELHKLAHGAVRGHSSIIVVGGGDGTINTFATALVGNGGGKTLGVLPLGTLNHFAQDLNIPLELDAAVRVIAAGHTTQIDVGEVNGRFFVNNSSLGLYPQIVRERVKQQRLGHGKWPAFVWAAIAVLRRYPFLDLRLEGAGTKMRCRAPFVFVGNNEYQMEGFQIGRRKRMNGGVLSVYVTRRVGRWGLIRLALRALFGHLRNEKDFEALTTKQLKIDSRHRRLRISFDGEIDVLETPLHYRVRPAALRVIVPEESGQ